MITDRLLINKLQAECAKQIPNFRDIKSLIVGVMDERREPLKEVCRTLYDQIQDVITDYLDDMEVSYEFDEDFDELIDELITNG